MPKPIIDNLGVSVGELKKQFALQLPTVAALIYTSQEGQPDPDAAAEEAVELVDALLTVIIEEVSA